MSADNWSQCPRCRIRVWDEKKAALEAVQATYGKIPADDFVADLERAKGMNTDLDNSVREDYEIFIDEHGRFVVSYSAGCRNGGCGYSFEYNHQEQTQVVR